MPTDWEERYRTGETPWDKGAPHPELVDFVRAHPLDGVVLVPGCGYGFDVRAISRTENKVLGIDIAPSAIRGAETFPKVAHERYELADFFEIGSRENFDWIFEHTCFCAIDPSQRADYAAAARNALKGGGKLLAIFYLDPGSDVGPPFGVTIAELDTLFGKSFDVLDEWVPGRTFPGREGRELLRILQKRA